MWYCDDPLKSRDFESPSQEVDASIAVPWPALEEAGTQWRAYCLPALHVRQRAALARAWTQAAGTSTHFTFGASYDKMSFAGSPAEGAAAQGFLIPAMRVIHVTPQGGLTFKSDGLVVEAETYTEPVQGLRLTAAVVTKPLYQVRLKDLDVSFFRVDGLDLSAQFMERGIAQQLQAIVKLAPSAFFPRALARRPDQQRSALRTFLARSQVGLSLHAYRMAEEAWTTATPDALVNWAYVHPLGKEDKEDDDRPIPHLTLRLTGGLSRVKLQIATAQILNNDDDEDAKKEDSSPHERPPRSGIWAGTELTYAWGSGERATSIETTLRYSSRTSRGIVTMENIFSTRGAATNVEASWVQRFGRVTTSIAAKVPISMQLPPALYFTVGTRV